MVIQLRKETDLDGLLVKLNNFIIEKANTL